MKNAPVQPHVIVFNRYGKIFSAAITEKGGERLSNTDAGEVSREIEAIYSAAQSAISLAATTADFENVDFPATSDRAVADALGSVLVNILAPGLLGK